MKGEKSSAITEESKCLLSSVGSVRYMERDLSLLTYVGTEVRHTGSDKIQEA